MRPIQCLVEIRNSFYVAIQYTLDSKLKILNTISPFSSAFFLFCSEYRPKIKGEHPGLSIGDVAKKLGEMWNNTAADDKQPYEKKAAKLKEKYEKVRRAGSLGVMVREWARW